MLIKPDNIIDRIKSFNEYLNTFDYGKVINGRRYTKNVNFDNYVTISPSDFEKYKCGVCWDFTTYEYLYFKKHFKICAPKCFYIQLNTSDDEEPTHTWLSFSYNNSIYAFESSWKSLQGVKKFATERNMLSFYEKQHKEASAHKTITGFIITEYIPPTKYGQQVYEFMDHCLKARTVRNDNFIYKKF